MSGAENAWAKMQLSLDVRGRRGAQLQYTLDDRSVREVVGYRLDRRKFLDAITEPTTAKGVGRQTWTRM